MCQFLVPRDIKESQQRTSRARYGLFRSQICAERPREFSWGGEPRTPKKKSNNVDTGHLRAVGVNIGVAGLSFVVKILGVKMFSVG